MCGGGLLQREKDFCAATEVAAYGGAGGGDETANKRKTN